jgi:hypothetical protein
MHTTLLIALCALLSSAACKGDSGPSAKPKQQVMHAEPGNSTPAAMLSDLRPQAATGRLELAREGRMPLPRETPLPKEPPPSMMLEDLANPAAPSSARLAPLGSQPAPLPREQQP